MINLDENEKPENVADRHWNEWITKKEVKSKDTICTQCPDCDDTIVEVVLPESVVESLKEVC